METELKGRKKRARIVLKAGRRGSQQSTASEQSTVDSEATTSAHFDQHTWASSVMGPTDGNLDQMIHMRNQLKKEIFGETFPCEVSQSYAVHSTPLHSRSSTGRTNHHTLHTTQGFQSGARYTGAISSASSEYDEPDFCMSGPAQRNDRLNTVLFLRHPDSWGEKSTTNNAHSHHTSRNRRATVHPPVQTSSNESSPLHRPISAGHKPRRKSSSKSKQRRNQVHPSIQDDTLSQNNSSPPGNIFVLENHMSPPDQITPSQYQNGLPTFNTHTGTDPEHTDPDSPTRQRLFSTTYSILSTLSTTLTPLLTQQLRKGGRKPSEKNCFDFDAEGQLLSCFPNRQIQVYIVTWNMQEQKLLPDSLDDLLLPLSQETAADMFVIGTQESTPSRQEWEILLQQTLGPSYVLVQSASLGIIYLTLYLRRDLIWFCSAVLCLTYATRLGSLIKTKGGVGISFTLFGTSFLFITSHFTAHDNKVQERNSDMQRIAANLSLSPDSSDKGSLLRSYDHVFWCGDLNYRVDTTRELADQCVASSDWMPLLLKDQLTKEILQGNVFQGFSEQPVSFPPSYKFDTNSSNYDSSEKRRVPSWTDRILFKSLKEDGITGCAYSSCSSLRISDHRPVYAVFKADLEPSKQLEGVPDKMVTFDQSTYIKAQQRRREVAEELALQRSPTEETDGPNHQPSKHVASSVCVVL